MWRFNRGANRLSGSTFVICRPLISTNWIYIVWECSYFSNLPLNRQISARRLIRPFLYILGSFKPPQSSLVTVCRSKPPRPLCPLLNRCTSLRFPPERGLGGKIKCHCLQSTWRSKPKCAALKLKHTGTWKLQLQPLDESWGLGLKAM